MAEIQEKPALLGPDTPHSDQEVYGFPGGVNIQFQRGAMELGRNGVTTAELLGVLIGHMEKYQQGKFACAENAFVVGCLKLALKMQELRAQKRAEQGILGRDAEHKS